MNLSTDIFEKSVWIIIVACRFLAVAVNGYVMQRKHERRGRGGGKGGGSSRVNCEHEGRI